jgi:hypothetical protein
MIHIAGLIDLANIGFALYTKRDIKDALEAISKPFIRLNVKAGRGGQPQQYTSYFEDWTPCPNAGFGLEGRF